MEKLHSFSPPPLRLGYKSSPLSQTPLLGSSYLPFKGVRFLTVDTHTRSPSSSPHFDFTLVATSSDISYRFSSASRFLLNSVQFFFFSALFSGVFSSSLLDRKTRKGCTKGRDYKGLDITRPNEIKID